jgi:hypothetical protein
MVSITPYEQAITDVVGAEVDSLRNDAGEIAKSPLEVFSKPLNANSVRALGLVDQDGNPTERGQLFYNLQQSGMFNEDGTINEKGQAYLTPIEEMKNPEWFTQPGSKEKFDILWEDGVIRSSSTPGEILSNVTKFAGDAVYGGAELAQQQAMGLAYNSRTWGGLLGMEDSRPDYLKARGEATELSIAENMYKNVIQTSNLIDVGLAADKQFIDESIMSPFYGALEKITGIQRPQPQEIDQANANIKNSKDALVAARYNQWATDQRLADMEAGEIGETVLGIDNAVQKAEAAKQELGNEEFNKVYGRVGAFTNIAGDPTNVIPAAFAVKASRAVPLASRAMLNAQKTMGNIAAMDLAIAQGNTAVQASRAALAKVEPTVNLAQRMAANFAEGAKTQPALLERSAKASQIASRVTAEANQIRSTLPTITAELDSLITKRNSLATRIPEAYSQKVLQTMELGRQMRAMPAKAVGATLERVGDTISKTDTAVTNFLQERGLDQMYTAAVGAAGVVGLAGNPIIGSLGAGAAALKTGRVLSNYGKLFRYVGKEMENVRGQIPFWKRVAAHTAPGSLGRGFAHTFNMLDLGGVTSDTIRRAGRGIAAAAPTDLMFEYLSDGADMRPETLWQAGAESFVIGGSFAAGGGAFMGTKKRMRELSIGDELNFRRNLTDTRQKALFEAIPAGTRRAISTYAIANPTLNYTFKDSGASRYDPNTNTAVINVNSTNPIKALVAHETLHHTVIKNNMEPGIAALFLGDTKNNTVGGLFRSRDGKLDPNFEAFRDGYYKRLGVEGMSNAERDAIYPLDKIAVEYFIEKHADQYAAMAESGELGAVASSGAARRKLGSILETVLPRIPVLKDLHFKSGGMIDKNGAWVTGNGILDAEGVKRDPITSKMFRDMNRRSAGLVPGQFDPLMSDKPDSGAPILLNPSDSIDAELLHPLVQVDDANKPIMKDGKPVALDRATELSRALAGLTAVEVMRRKRAENYAPEKGEAHVDDEGQFQPGWLSNDVLTEMFAKNKYNPEQKRIIREMNKLIRKGAGDRVVMINFPATTRNKAGKVVYKPQGATLRDTVPVAVTISKDGNLLFGLMSVTKLHENIQKRSQDRRGKKLYGGNVDLILRDTQAMMDYHKQGLDSIEFFKQKYGAVEADERKKFINTMFGLLNQKEQAVLNPMLLEDGIKSKDNVYRTYRADRVSKAVPMAPEEYAAMPFSYEAVSQVRMPEAQRAMPEGEQGGDVTLTRLREIRDGLDENLTEREAIDELDFIINDAPSGYFPQDILNKVDQAKRDLEEEFTTWAGRGDSEASTESAISSVMSFLDSKESRGEAAPTRFMPEGEQTQNIDDIRKQWDNLGIQHGLSERSNEIEPGVIKVPKENRNQGIGNKAMSILIDYADQVGKRIVVSPTNEFGSNKQRLTNWYKKLGFVENKGRNKDYTTRKTMYRDPISKAVPSQGSRFMPEGVDEDKFYSQLERVITDKVPTRATAQQIMATIDPTRGSGVKADEIKWSGIEQALTSLEKDGKVSKEDLLNYLRNEGRVRFEEVTISEGRQAYEAERAKLGEQMGRGEITSEEFRRLVDELDAKESQKPEPKYAQYQLPGGENYREVVLAMPTQGGVPDGHTLEAKSNNGNQRWFLRNAEGRAVAVGNSRDDALLDYYAKYPKAASEYTSPHFPDIPNYVAHIRTNERALDDGSEGLFVEEFQSDRHQAGRKKGYRGDLEAGFSAKQDNENFYIVADDDGRRLTSNYSSRENAINAFNQGRSELGVGGVADAPFRTTWPIQLFKRALRDAVDGGKDWIGWTTGETQNDRFDLSKSLDSIEVRRIDGSNRVTVYGTKGNNNVITQQSTLEALPDVIGKELAEKVISDMSPKGTPQQIQRAKIAAEEARNKLQQPGVGYDSPLFDEYERKAEEFRVLNGKSDVSYSGLDLKVGGSGMKGFYDNMLPKEVGKYVKQFGGKVERADMTQSVEADIMSGEEAETGSIPIWKVNITPEMRKISQTGQMRFMPEGDVEPVKKPTEISKGTKDALPVIQAVDDKGELKFKDGKPVPQIIPYNFLKSPKLVEYDKNNPTDKTKTNYAELAYDIPKSAQKKIDQAIDSGAVDAVVGDVVKRTKKYLENPEIAAGMGWYSRMRVKLVKALGEQGRETLSQLLGATSARTPVRENFLQAMDAYEGINAGRYEPNRKAYIDMLQLEESGTLADEIVNRGYLDILSSKINDIEEKAKSLKGQDQSNLLKEAKNLKSLINQKPESWKPSQRAKIMILATDMLPKRSNGKKFNANSLAVLKVIHGSWLDNRNAPKTPNFAGNLSGRTLQATIDVWAARFLRAVLYEGKKTPWRIQPKAESAVTNEDFAIGQIIFERAAKKLKMNPDDLQAVLWFAEKDRWDKMGWTQKVGAEKSSFDDIFSIFFPDKQKPLSFEEASAKLASEGYAESAQNLDQETEDNE